MKRFWLVLLSLGLIVAFSTSAMAVDVKFSGEYYAAGMYLDKGALLKDRSLTNTSTAFYFQRLRLTTTFVVAPGLFLNTRADIMERIWGGKRSDVPLAATNDYLSAATRAENENIGFDLAYVTYISPIGIFLAGYQIDGAWGTVFGDSSQPTPKIGYMFRGGPVTLGLQTGKAVNTSGGIAERSRTALNATNATDRDDSFVTAYGIFAWKTGQAGLLGKYFWVNGSRNVIGDSNPYPSPVFDTGVKVNYLVLAPYVKAQLGPVAIQSELYWLYGKQKWEGRPDLIGAVDIDMNALSFWVDATADFSMFYAGGTFAYISGDDPATKDKAEGGLSGGMDWNPCLIMFNYDLTYWAGAQLGSAVSAATTTTNKAPMTNAFFLQARAGVRPVDKLDIMASVSWAQADKTLANQWQGRGYGYEVDLTATYKITNNLSYMLGGGYFITGDWYKGQNASGTNETQNQFMVINKLTLTF